jgi:hypothetical protein
MRRALVVCLGLFVLAQPARAQTRIYVTGDLFAEVPRLSRTNTPELLGSGPDATGPGDAVTLGGGARIGAFFTPAWSLEFGTDIGKAIREERTLTARLPAGLAIPVSALQYRSRTRLRYSASSVLVGYHPPARGRIHAGFRGGVSFMHTERMFTTSSVGVTFSSTLPQILLGPTISVVTDEYTIVANGLTATLAAEAAIDLSTHLALVPEMRAHAGGIGGILLRPGVAGRWRW